ncbi:hypothetical protein V5O48_019633, partial [Marasmius crinis-equi]
TATVSKGEVTETDGKDKDGNAEQKGPESVKEGSIEGDGETKDNIVDKYSVSIRQSIVKTEFEKLMAKEQEKWKQLAKEEHAKRKREYQDLLEAGYSKDPVKRVLWVV